MLTLPRPAAPLGARRPGLPMPGLSLTLLLLAILVTWWITNGTLAATTPPPDFPVEVITEDFTVDWSGDGRPPFDPRNRCPEDFLSRGFVLLVKKASDGYLYRFLYHKGKRLLYRLDIDDIRGVSKVGLHWVASTRFNARYRIADPSFKTGKAVASPNGKGGTTTATYRYGDPVSKKKSRYDREFFRSTHIQTSDDCPDWFDLFTLPL